MGALIDSGALPADRLLPVIDAHEMEIEPAIESRAAWRDWLLAGEGGLAVAAAHLLGAPEPEAARGAGAAYGAACVIRWNAVLAAKGRCLLPLDVLSAAGLSLEEAIDDPLGRRVAAALRGLAAEGQTWLTSGWLHVPKPWRAAVLPAVLARRDRARATGVVPEPRGLGDRLAVIRAGLTGWV